MSRTIVLLLLTAILAAGCASYEAAPAPLARIDALPSRVSEQGLVAAADPYLQSERQRSVFKADFHKAGVLAIQVVARNDSAAAKIVRRSDMMLTLPDGTRISPASADAVATKIGEEGSVVGAYIAFGVIGALVASSAEDEARTKRAADYNAKQFGDVRLRPGDSAQGFVYFMPPKGMGFAKAGLAVRFVDEGTASDSYITLPLKNVAFGQPPEDELPEGYQPLCRDVGGYEAYLNKTGKVCRLN